MNFCVISGRLVKEPEFKTVNGREGEFLAGNFSMAVYRSKEVTDFLNFSVTGKAAERLQKWAVLKGQNIVCQCSAEQRTWEKDGQKRSAVQFHVLNFEAGAKPKGQEGLSAVAVQKVKEKFSGEEITVNSPFDEDTIPF